MQSVPGQEMIKCTLYCSVLDEKIKSVLVNVTERNTRKHLKKINDRTIKTVGGRYSTIWITAGIKLHDVGNSLKKINWLL